MKVFSTLVVVVSLAAGAVSQKQQIVQGPSPQEIVQELWMNASAGSLLTRSGLARMSTRYYEFAPDFLAKPIRVVSNYWGVDSEKIAGQKATVIVSFYELGKLDSKLRFRDDPDDPLRVEGFRLL